MRNIFILGFAVVLSGCVPDKIETPPVNLALTSAGKAAQPSAYTPMTVRAFENVGKNRVWIEERHGVACSITSKYYSASFQAGAVLNMPNFGNALPKTEITCSYDGETFTQGVSCFFSRNKEPGADPNFPRGLCGFAEKSFIFKR